MSIGIVGAGAVGSAIGSALARAGIDAKILNRRGPAALGPLSALLAPHVTAGTREEVLGADIVFVAVPWTRLGEALGGVDWTGRIVVDCTNALEGPSFKPVDLGGLSSSEAFASFVPGARVVKTINHLLPHLLAGDPRAEGGRRVLFMAGDDAAAKAKVASIIDRIGFYRVDLGGLREGGRLIEFPGGPLPALDFVVFD
ncbi:MAG TPA: NAD(P)-binding domain-containing protein [Devosia sp.]|nr:NAD(P)-binding domain-containing protein [Devosia sp.]